MESEWNQSVFQEIEESSIAVFLEEAAEKLATLEANLLELENTPDDQELIAASFRALHTIKGSGAMFGFTDIESFTHTIENVFDQVRAGTIPVTDHLIALALEAHDQIGRMLDAPGSDEENIRKREEIVAALEMLLPRTDPEDLRAMMEPGWTEEASPTQMQTFRIRFRPATDLFSFGTNPLLLLEELKELGDCLVVAQTDGLPDFQGLDPENCYTAWDIILTTNRGINPVRDVFMFVEDNSELAIQVIDVDDDDEMPEKKLGEILVERGDLEREALSRFLEKQERIGQRMEQVGLVAPDRIESALAEQSQMKRLREDRKKNEVAQNIRISSAKLDKIIDLVGELVTGQARLSRLAGRKNDASLLTVSEHIERLVAELRDNTISVRMVRFGNTFGKFRRLVRDLSEELGKEIDLVTEGEETELDKSVIDQLTDPLVHIIRNSADHGISSPEERLAAGKPRGGTIHLSAAYVGAQVVIRIRDDGEGMDKEVIRRKAVENGLISAESRLSEAETFSLIFEPGFSTAGTITHVSGRGVGMDVVKKTISAIRGTVEVASRKGEGTTVSIRLPLTLAIIDGLLVEVGDEQFIIPLVTVEECVELAHQGHEQNSGRRFQHVRGHIVPYIRLREQFGINGTAPDIEQIVITEIENRRVGFVVDRVLGQHQTVIKNLNKVCRQVDTVSGATIMADGNVALILDIHRCFHMVEKHNSMNSSQEPTEPIFPD